MNFCVDRTNPSDICFEYNIFSEFLKQEDIESELVDSNGFDSADEFNHHVVMTGADCVLAIHAYRSGQLLLGKTHQYPSAWTTHTTGVITYSFITVFPPVFFSIK